MNNLDSLEIYSKQISTAFTKLELIIKDGSSDNLDKIDLNYQFNDELKEIQSTVILIIFNTRLKNFTLNYKAQELEDQEMLYQVF